jgi:hypothetical protein
MLGMGIKFTADASGVQRAVAGLATQTEKQFAGIGNELTKRIAGAFAAGAVVSAVGNFISSVRQSVDEIKDLSDQLELSTDDVQRLQKAANDAGVKFGVITTALQKIEAKKAEALSGDPKAAGLFAALGANPGDSALSILQRATEESSKSTEKNAAAFELLGKKAVILKNIVTELKNQGPIKLISEDQIQKIDEVNAGLEEAARYSKAAAAPAIEKGLRFLGAFATMTNPSKMVDINKRAFERKDLGFLGRLGMINAEFFGVKDTEGEKTEPADLQEALRKRKGVATAPAAAAATVPATSAISLGTQGDALSRIGLFVGGRPEVGALRNIEANTRETAQGMRQLLTAMRETRDAIQYHNE